MKRLLLLNIAVLCICSSNFALCEESKGFDSTHLQTKETAEQAKILSRLEALEIRVEQQDETNAILTRKLRNQMAQSINSKKEVPVVASSVDSRVNTAFPRSCQEIRDTNPQINTNGLKYIDPDGPAVGDPPFQVTCLNGKTSVGHNSEATIVVSPICDNDGCYVRNITYNTGATIRQMSALIALSTDCQQRFTYGCVSAFLEFSSKGTKQVSWWNDRFGNKQYFWAGKLINGATPNEQHMCQCGIEGKCSDSSFSCNCDILPGTKPYIDDGFITEMSLLPVTRLNFGKIVTSANHTLGKLECVGSKGIQIGQPTGCRDLYQLGHNLNGFYTVRGLGTSSNDLETVYCDFSVPAIDSTFETRLGILCTDCQKNKTQVYFYVQRFNGLSGFASTISFEKEVLNVGGAMNLATGIFKAPVAGIYFFSFSGYKCPSSSTYIYLYLNEITSVGLAAYGFDASPFSEKYSIESTLRLQKGDTISLLLNGCILEGVDIECRVSHFNGWLLMEEE